MVQRYKMRSTTSGLSDHQQKKRKSIEFDHPDVVLIGRFPIYKYTQYQQTNLIAYSYVDHVKSKLSIESNNSSRIDSLLRASSITLWFQSRNTTSSLERYLSTVRSDDIHNMMVIDSIRQSLIDKEIHQQSGDYVSHQVM